MKNFEYAQQMYVMAQKDYRALQGMLDSEQFDDEIFGFHAQQALEKGLKALLIKKGLDFERTHDLRLLLKMVETSGEKLPKTFWDIIELNSFSVQYRYEPFYTLASETINRRMLLKKVEQVMKYIGKQINH